MSSLSDMAGWIDAQLPALAAKYGVPGAALAVLRGDEVIEAATGVLNRATDVRTTTDSLFQIGSITKLWTATLVMQLVDEGRLDLEAPVRACLPQFRAADEVPVTVRQLLDHTAGFEGDIFTDTGVGDDCLEKFIGVLDEVPRLFPPGEQFSYNNAGYCVLGRVVEVLREKTYDQCLQDHLFTPLGLQHAAAGPYQAIRFRAALGHLEGGEPAPVWALARSNAPAGAMLAMRPADLIAFARMHLSDGRAADGTRVLAEGTAARMHEKQVEVPELGVMGSSWGLGFERFDLPDGQALIGHDGNTIGQAAFLRMVPAEGVAIALLTNGGNAAELYRDVFDHVLGELTGRGLAPLPKPPAVPERIDASRFVGTYSAQVADLAVSQDQDGRIWIEQTPRGIFAELGEQPQRTELLAYRENSLIPAEPTQGLYVPHVFLGDDGQGRAQYLHIGRAIRRSGKGIS